VTAPDGGSGGIGTFALTPLLPATAALAALYALIATPLLFADGVDRKFVALSCLLAGALALLSAIDLREYRLPDVLTLPLAGLGLVATPLLLAASPAWQLVSALIGFALMAGIGFAYHRLRGVPGLGLGDAKLLAAAGAWLGAQALPSVLLWACAAAIIAIGIRGWRTRSLSARTRVPFGPFLAFGTWLVWLYGPL
jgi:leader peptidase (prepilin peptidase) / N-methyltransferase